MYLVVRFLLGRRMRLRLYTRAWLTFISLRNCITFCQLQVGLFLLIHVQQLVANICNCSRKFILKNVVIIIKLNIYHSPISLASNQRIIFLFYENMHQIKWSMYESMSK